MPLSNLTYDDIQPGEVYKLIPDFHEFGSCGSVPHFASKTTIYIKIDQNTGSALSYWVGGKENSCTDHCSMCVKPEHLLPLVEEVVKSVSIQSVVIAPQKRQQILAAISQPQHTEKIFTEWGFEEVFEKGTAVSLLFYGVPGTGKTLTAQAIADELGMELKILGTADIESSEPGGAERSIRAFFKEAQKKYDAHAKNPKTKAQILLFDECDSLLTDRNSIGVILAAQVNCLLTELEKYKGVVIFTTNRLGKLDPAFERRVTAKIEFEFPNEDPRQLWHNGMAQMNIGQMLDFLTKDTPHGCLCFCTEDLFSRLHGWRLIVGKNPKNSVYPFIPELCDALWEACKDILNTAA